MNARVYLAGGLKTDWQDKVRAAITDGVEWFDPRELDQDGDLKALADAERQWLRLSHIVFAYAEATNPLPVGLAFELGWAEGTGGTTILVDERETPMAWLGANCEHYVRTLDEGLEILRQEVRRWS